MSETVLAQPAPTSDSNAPEHNPAVLYCCQAHRQAAKAAREKGMYDFEIDRASRRAYCNAMPALAGIESIRDFIACVAHGMLLNFISGPEGARLLYAAQVASGVAAKLDRPTPGKPGRPPATPLPKN
jgi:hypothetical protein